MVTVKRPSKIFSFGDFAKTSPTQPPPGDRLDAQFYELQQAIESTQAALAEIRRDDGQLRTKITKHHLDPAILKDVTDTITTAAAPVRHAITQAITGLAETEHRTQSYAQDAERAVQVASQLVNGLAALRQMINSKSDTTVAAQDVVQMLTTEAENWANYSHANADNAETWKEEALQWAEYLAGPVVDAGAAPGYIANSRYPTAYFYQTIQGGVAGLWSAKWWALQAFNLVGMFSMFYLGPWDHGPLPGEQNPATGIVAPNPILIGSFYYNTTTHQIYVWDGTEWRLELGLLNGSVQGTYTYIATAGQQDFSGIDIYGQTPLVGDYPSQVFINGVRLIAADFSVSSSSNTLHINAPVTANSVVAWDLLKEPLVQAAINGHKIINLVPDGTKTDFTLQYLSPIDNSTQDANLFGSVELFLILDGIPQEPGIDFTATGKTLHMLLPVPADAHFWAVWYQPMVTTTVGLMQKETVP